MFHTGLKQDSDYLRKHHYEVRFYTRDVMFSVRYKLNLQTAFLSKRKEMLAFDITTLCVFVCVWICVYEKEMEAIVYQFLKVMSAFLKTLYEQHTIRIDKNALFMVLQKQKEQCGGHPKLWGDSDTNTICYKIWKL
jgi:hypothetical protein